MAEFITLDGTTDASGFLTGEALTALERDVAPEYLRKQRWFADKDAAGADVRFSDLASAVTGAEHVYFALIDLPARGRSYFMPLAIGQAADGAEPRGTLARVRGNGGDRDAYLYDGFASDAFVRTLVDDVRSERHRAGALGGTFAGHATETLDALTLSAELPVRRLSVEQSNTSVVVDERIMIKGYRKANKGPQPELEMARFLDWAEYRNTPALLGYMEYESPNGEPTAIAILQAFAPNDGDAWAVVLKQLEEFFERATAAGAADGEAQAVWIAEARALGVRTAELHRAFALPTDDAAFAPEETTDADLRQWEAQARETASAALDALERGRDRVPPDVLPIVDALLADRERVLQRCAVPDIGAGVMKTRFHGDYHLGQVLVSGGDFLLVDFEGEPGRDLATRRRKTSPLRDVAGMVRSLDYAAVSAMRASAEKRGTDASEFAAHGRAWGAAAVAAFLDGYRTTIAGCASYPADVQAAQALLELFVLEKAFYEVSYELANRPNWLRIPLEGIRAILDPD